MSRSTNSNRDDFSRRPKKDKKTRGGGKNYTQFLLEDFDNEVLVSEKLNESASEDSNL